MINNNKIGIFDIETFTYKDIYYPFAIGIFINNSFKYFYLDDSNNISIDDRCKNLIIDSLNYLSNINNIKQYVIYVHNFGKFDSIFILKYFPENINLFYHNNCVYQITCNGIKFHDSYKIINRSLKDACEAFNVKNKKIDIDYNTFVYTNLFIESFKINLILYLEYDCLSLYEIMEFFVNKIYSDYGVKCETYLTIASLAFKI